MDACCSAGCSVLCIDLPAMLCYVAHGLLLCALCRLQFESSQAQQHIARRQQTKRKSLKLKSNGVMISTDVHTVYGGNQILRLNMLGATFRVLKTVYHFLSVYLYISYFWININYYCQLRVRNFIEWAASSGLDLSAAEDAPSPTFAAFATALRLHVRHLDASLLTMSGGSKAGGCQQVKTLLQVKW